MFCHYFDKYSIVCNINRLACGKLVTHISVHSCAIIPSHPLKQTITGMYQWKSKCLYPTPVPSYTPIYMTGTGPTWECEEVKNNLKERMGAYWLSKWREYSVKFGLIVENGRASMWCLQHHHNQVTSLLTLFVVSYTSSIFVRIDNSYNTTASTLPALLNSCNIATMWAFNGTWWSSLLQAPCKPHISENAHPEQMTVQIHTCLKFCSAVRTSCKSLGLNLTAGVCVISIK
jgi:hypothetical protein